MDLDHIPAQTTSPLLSSPLWLPSLFSSGRNKDRSRRSQSSAGAVVGFACAVAAALVSGQIASAAGGRRRGRGGGGGGRGEGGGGVVVVGGGGPETLLQANCSSLGSQVCHRSARAGLGAASSNTKPLFLPFLLFFSLSRINRREEEGGEAAAKTTTTKRCCTKYNERKFRRGTPNAHAAVFNSSLMSSSGAA